MTTGSVPLRYARALLAIADEKDALADMHREWTDIGATVEAAPELLPALANPRVPLERRKEALQEILRAVGASPQTLAAVGLMFRKGRILLLGDVARAFDRLVETKTGRVRSKVTTAVPMPETFHERLKTALERSTGRTVTIERRVDPEILGGAVAQVGDLLYDGSLRTALARLRERLMEEA